MSKMENNRYNNSKIYKLQDQIHGYFYIGSTCDLLSKRFTKHKSYAKAKPDTKIYKCFNEIGWENVKIVLIEEHYLENKEQLLREEDRAIQMYIHDPFCLNSNRAWTGLSAQDYHKAYRQEHEQEITLYKKQHYENNKSVILEKQHEYALLNKAEISRRKRKSTIKTKIR